MLRDCVLRLERDSRMRVDNYCAQEWADFKLSVEASEPLEATNVEFWRMGIRTPNDPDPTWTGTKTEDLFKFCGLFRDLKSIVVSKGKGGGIDMKSYSASRCTGT